MSIDRSLKSGRGLSRHRNVLSRAERIELLTTKNRFDSGDEPFGLPKVANRKVRASKSAKKKDAEAEAAPEAAPEAESTG